VTHAIRARPPSALLVLALLLGLLGSGVVVAHPGAGRASHQGVAASPFHAGQLVLPDRNAGLRALAERGHRHGSAGTGTWLAALVAALLPAALASRGRVWRSAGAAGSRGRLRRTRPRAPPSYLQLPDRAPASEWRGPEAGGSRCLVTLDGACSASLRCWARLVGWPSTVPSA